MIGKHYNDFEEAMNTLVDNFGHPGQVWNSCKDNIKEKLGGNFAKCWGANGSKQRSLAIARWYQPGATGIGQNVSRTSLSSRGALNLSL